MSEEQRKRDDDSYREMILEWTDYNPGLEIPPRTVYDSALAHCRETEVKELKEKIENDDIPGFSIRPRIMHENDKEIYVFQCNRIVQLREQLRVAVELLKEGDCASASCSGKVGECWRSKRDLFIQKIEAMKGGGDESR